MYILYVFSCWIRTTDETIIYMMFNQQQYAENIDNRWFFMLRIVIIMFFCPCSLGSNSVLPDPALSNLARIKRNDVGEVEHFSIPICSMYGIFIYLQNWVIFRANVGKYCIHGAYGIVLYDFWGSGNCDLWTAFCLIMLNPPCQWQTSIWII